MPLPAGRLGIATVPNSTTRKGSSGMRLSRTPARTSAVFDDPNLVSSAGLVPVLALAEQAGLRELADAHLTVSTDKGANPGLKVDSLVAGMVAGADSIDDMALLRHGGMGSLFARVRTLDAGSFLRAFTFGHIRQLNAVAFHGSTDAEGIFHVTGTGTLNGATFQDAAGNSYSVSGAN
jgi:hypothetical protein